MHDDSTGGCGPGPRRTRYFTAGRLSALAAILVAVVLLAGIPAADEPKLQEEVQALVDHLEARTVGCPAELLAADVLERTYCAATDLEFKSLRKAVLKFIRKNRNVGAAQLGEWSKLDGGLHATPLLLNSLVLRMVFDPRSATLILIPNDGCVEGSGAMSPGLFQWTVLGLEEPEKLNFPRPEFPERARAARVAGVVVLQAVVRKDGTTAEHCLLYGQPAGYGFVESALDALKRARYKPATLDGEPVEIVLTAGISFTYGR